MFGCIPPRDIVATQRADAAGGNLDVIAALISGLIVIAGLVLWWKS
jgi:hypothetical protein